MKFGMYVGINRNNGLTFGICPPERVLQDIVAGIDSSIE